MFFNIIDFIIYIQNKIVRSLNKRKNILKYLYIYIYNIHSLP